MSLSDSEQPGVGELSFRSPSVYRAPDKAYGLRSPSTLPATSASKAYLPCDSPSQQTIAAVRKARSVIAKAHMLSLSVTALTYIHLQGRAFQSPQALKTPDHSAVARLKNELQDERKKLQVPSILQLQAAQTERSSMVLQAVHQ